MNTKLLALLTFCCPLCAAKPADPDLAGFRKPANEYRPMPFWHLNGPLNRDTIRHQMYRAKYESGFGRITILPVSRHMTPPYLSEEYFDRYRDMLEFSRKHNMELILYDDIDFPSGWAGGKLLEQHPEYTRKVLRKDEYVITGKELFEKRLPDPEVQDGYA